MQLRLESLFTAEKTDLVGAESTHLFPCERQNPTTTASIPFVGFIIPRWYGARGQVVFYRFRCTLD
jgi:hypothetical protein